jgi:DNA-binding beta-propeller fold protein YncE
VTPRRLLLLILLATTGTGVAVAAVVVDRSGRIGPKNHIQNNGRLLNPFGRAVGVGNFPTGGALTRDGHFFWTLSAGRGKNDIRIVQVAKTRTTRAGRVVQTISMPGLSGGIVMSPDGRTAYVSGVAESDHKDQQTAADVPGKQGDVIHVFGYDRRTGRAVRQGVIPVPPPAGAPPYQDLPIPAPNTKLLSYPRDLAISRDGHTLLAALNLADTAAIVDTKSRKARYVRVGHYPYGAAISRDGKRGFVTSETEGLLTAIDLGSGKKIADIPVGAPLSHPEGMASDTRSNLIFTAITHQDNIAAVDSRTLKLVKTIHVGRPEGIGTFPTALKVTRDGCSLLAAMSGEDSVAVIALSRKRTCDRGSGRRRTRRAKPLTVVGHIPVGSYPTAVDATPARRTLVWLSARGLGTGGNPNGPNPLSPANNDDQINRFQYLPSFVRGSAGYGSFPTDIQVGHQSRQVYAQLRPTDSRKPPAGTPVRANGPIKHVFYIVKENRTYDQMIGDDPRGDGDPKLTLFGQRNTPNLHALARRFPLLDHVYANSEASIDGHYWTAAGAVSDYVVKAWHQNYAGRGRPYDFGAYEVSAPPKNYIFQRAELENVSYFNYGEALAGLGDGVLGPDKDLQRGGSDDVLNKKVLANSDVGAPLPDPPFCYQSDLSNSTVLSSGKVQVYDSSLVPPPAGAEPGAKSRYDCFNRRFTQQLTTNSVPAFSYLVLPNDHTEGTRIGRRTPRAQVASNDLGLGQIVDRISHSPVWKSSLILVVEDDSQDGADHVDAHRIPALAISPYTRRGAVVHDRYDQVSFLKTLEVIVGMKPKNLAEALAVPLYSAFGSSPANAEPYSAVTPAQSLTEKNTASTPGAKYSKSLNLGPTDNVPQRTLDGILRRYGHGAHSQPPPPGPNASGQDENGEKDR